MLQIIEFYFLKKDWKNDGNTDNLRKYNINTYKILNLQNSKNFSLAQQNLFQQYLCDNPDTRYLDTLISDLSCIMRGKRYPVSQAYKVFKQGMMCPGSTCFLSVTGDSMDPEYMGISDGDPDEVGIPLPHTLVPSPWTQVPTAQVMLTFQNLAGEPYYFEPRNVLKRVLNKFKSLGLHPIVAFEPEFYLLDEKRGTDHAPISARTPMTGRRTETTQVYSIDEVEDFSLYLDEVTSTCMIQGITTGAISKEYSPAQFEINLQHSDNPMQAADHYIMFRRVVQGVARKHGFQATFMAKPFPDRSGSGLHLHISLLDDSGQNVFAGDGEFGTTSCVSNILMHSLGGLTATMSDCMGILAPNINSYRRFQPNIYVPVAPEWGFENRSVAFRIPKSYAEDRRIEHRVAGADANPYLVLAVVLASIHHGITDRIPPGNPASGNTGELLSPEIPFDLTTAMQFSRSSGFLAEYLGRDYIKTYTSCKLLEYQKFQNTACEDFYWYL